MAYDIYDSHSTISPSAKHPLTSTMSSTSSGNNHGSKDHQEQDDPCLTAMLMSSYHIFPVVLYAAVELDLFGIIAREGRGGFLSPSEVCVSLGSNRQWMRLSVHRKWPPCILFNFSKVLENEKLHDMKKTCSGNPHPFHLKEDIRLW